MKRPRTFLSIAAVLAVGLGALALFGCSSKEELDPSQEKFAAYAQRVPEDAAFFLGVYCPTEYQKKIIADAGRQKFTAALRGNAVIADAGKTFLASAEKEAPELPLREIFGDDPIATLADAFDAKEAPFAAVFFAEGPLDFSDGGNAEQPDWTLAATVPGGVAKRLLTLVASLAKEHEIYEDGARALFTFRDVRVLFRGNEVIAAPSRERIEAFEKSLAAPAPARGVFDAPLFVELAKGAPAKTQIFAYLNFDGVKDFRAGAGDIANPWAKEFFETARGVAAFGDFFSSVTSAESVIRAAFSRPGLPHKVIGAMVARGPDALGSALPDAAIALGIGVPALTPEILEALDLSEDSPSDKEVVASLRRLDVRTFCISFSDVEKAGNLVRYNFLDTPRFFAKFTCGDVSALLENADVAAALDGGNPMIGKQKIGEDEIYGTTMFGVRFAPLGGNAFYASDLPDAPAALKLAKGEGESLASAGTFASVAKKLRGNNAFEFFSDSLKLQQMQTELARASGEVSGKEEAAELAALSRRLRVEECLEAFQKKSRTGTVLRVDGNAIELRSAAEFETDFGALADELGKIR